MSAVLLMLAMTACGSDDDPQDAILYMQPTIFINHVYNTQNGEVEELNVGEAEMQINTSKMTADVNFAIKINGENIVATITNAHVTTDNQRGGYMIATTTPVIASGHTINSFNMFVETNTMQYFRHFIKATIDNNYEVNAMMSSIFYKHSLTELPSSEKFSSEKYSYQFQFTNLATDNNIVNVAISGIDVVPFNSGVMYKGLDFEPYNDGIHIFHTADEGIDNNISTNYQLTNMDTYINMREHSFEAEYTIDGIGLIKANGEMF